MEPEGILKGSNRKRAQQEHHDDDGEQPSPSNPATRAACQQLLTLGLSRMLTDPPGQYPFSASSARRFWMSLPAAPAQPQPADACRHESKTAPPASTDPVTTVAKNSSSAKLPSTNAKVPRARHTAANAARTTAVIASIACCINPSTCKIARNASCGTSTEPICFMRFLPAFCFSRSLRLREMSPP